MSANKTLERWKSEGRCVGCGDKHGTREEGKTRCTHCRLRSNASKRSPKGRAAADAYRKAWESAGVCVDCGGKNGEKVTSVRCAVCRDRSDRGEKKVASHKEWVAARRLAGLCQSCGSPEVCTGGKCSECRKKAAARLRSIRRGVFARYGGFVCSCCGFEGEPFCALDHVNNDGKIQREEIKGAEPFYKWIIANNYPDSIQVLCHSCNFAKRHNGGICPHKKPPSYLD